ncbi:PREDICTED: carboxypeptidase B-like [Dinoponera quadriceps]|uniref:Carboxypeptidase B-like n=1 Tax=Dinoponera quadriceps TaxID=609295 RepID=A0A6P3XXA6_DINQU|nr:PREDICTED: carboxypeptidase B-like [Dinoponera quadriceps]
MSAGVRLILCAIIGISGNLMLHPVNSSPYRDCYTVTYSQHYHDYWEKKTQQRETITSEESSSLQAVHSNQDTQLSLSPNDTKGEIIDLIGASNQEVPRESPYWDDDYDRGFSLIGLFESMISVVASGISTVMNSIVGTEKKNSRSRVSRINYRNYQLIRIYPNTENHVADLRDLRDAEPEDIKFWSFPIPNRTSDVIVAPDLVADVKDYLKDKKINFKVVIPDIQKAISYQNPKMSKEQREDLVTIQGHTMTWKRYHRYGDIVRYLEYLSSRYPKMIELTTIGHSYEGQPIKMAKVSTGLNKDGERKPAIWIDAGMHGREWIGTAVATYILSQLAERNTSYSKLLDNSDWMILPVANPDGYEYSHTGDRFWRKTRSNHVESQEDSRYTPSNLLQFVTHYTRWFWTKCEGVDPNRNFAYHWGEAKEGGTSSDPCHETYSGPFAFSEPETKAIANYILANKQHIRMYLSLHSYSQMWLVPWGYTRSKPSDYSDLMNVAKRAINAIAKVHGTHYQLGPMADLMYPTSGASDDWAKGVAGIKYAYTVELRDRGTYGFLLPASQIVPTAREIWAGIRAIARLVTCNT